MRSIRLLSVIFAILVITCVPCAAADNTFSAVTVHFSVDDIPTLVECDVTFSILDETGNAVLDTNAYHLKRGDRYFSLCFSVPEYNIGQRFVLRLDCGAKSFGFDGSSGNSTPLETFVYADEAGNAVYQTDFYMSLTPMWNKEAVIKVKGVSNTFYAHAFVGDELYVTTDLLSALKIHSSFEQKTPSPYVFLTADDNRTTAQFFIDNIYAVKNGNPYNLTTKPFTINSYPYVPLYDVATHFACSYTVEEDTPYRRVISLNPTAYAYKNPAEKYVNSLDLNSRTDYLIWVSKKDYKVNVFVGSKGCWSQINSFSCAIGAPSTPTVEGVFEYYQKQPRWNYDDFYCGPVMRFYNGYAIHSTLIKYNGKAYDSRLGMKISHGCVRVLPDDINWLVNNIPLNTRILVTA